MPGLDKWRVTSGEGREKKVPDATGHFHAESRIIALGERGGNLEEQLRRCIPPQVFSYVRQIKDFKSNVFISAVNKGLTDAFFGCAVNKGLSEFGDVFTDEAIIPYTKSQDNCKVLKPCVSSRFGTGLHLRGLRV